MADGPGFEAYLGSKMIDSGAFRKAEPDVWDSWKREFEQMHPLSFTVQKLNLINVVRRKYLLAIKAQTKPADLPPDAIPNAPARPGKPVMKPKTN